MRNKELEPYSVYNLLRFKSETYYTIKTKRADRKWLRSNNTWEILQKENCIPCCAPKWAQMALSSSSLSNATNLNPFSRHQIFPSFQLFYIYISVIYSMQNIIWKGKFKTCYYVRKGGAVAWKVVDDSSTRAWGTQIWRAGDSLMVV